MATNFVDTSDFTGRALLVEGIGSVHSQMQTADKITIHFQKRVNKGGDVTKVLYPLDSNRDAAIVVFEDANYRESALGHQHVFHKVKLRVQRLPPVFRSVEVEIDPVYVKLLPKMVDNLIPGQGSSRTSSFGRQNIHKLSFSSPSELRYAEEKVYKSMARQSETAHFSTGASGYSDPEEARLIEQERIRHEEEFAHGDERNRCKETEPGDEDPEDFPSQQTTERDNSGAHASGDKSFQGNESTTDVQPRRPQDQTSRYDDENAFSTEKKNSITLDIISYNFIMKFEKDAVDQILKKYNVKINEINKGLMLTASFAARGKTSAEEIQKAIDEFTTLHQTTYGKLSRKTVECPPSISTADLERAALKTSKVFKSKALITKIDGNPVQYVILSSSDAGEVAQHFRKEACIPPKKKLRTAKPTPGPESKENVPEQATEASAATNQSMVSFESYGQNKTGSLSGSSALRSSQTPDDPFVTNEGMAIFIHKGDITKQSEVDAIVNPTDRNLSNCGGASKAIGTAAGPKLKEWCDQFMKTRQGRCLQDSEWCVSPGYGLNCGFIIHIGPVNVPYINKQQQMMVLDQTFVNCLVAAHSNNLKSLAMPLLCSGSAGAPKEACADALVHTLITFSREPSRVLREVYLVNIDSAANKALKHSLESAFKETRSTISGDQHSSAPSVHNSRSAEMSLVGKSTVDFKDRPTDYSGKMPIGQNVSNTQPSADQDQGTKSTTEKRQSDTKTDFGAGPTSERKDATNAASKDCPICLLDIIDVKILKCSHRFCRKCIDKALIQSHLCPICRAVSAQPKGIQPEGTMNVTTNPYTHLPGYADNGTINIYYSIPSGRQSECHPHPGKYFTGVTRTAYLPDTREGRKVLSLLKKAFDARLVFTVGQSITSGSDDTVTWNDIHHKTNQTGGPSNYGYPDPGYLQRVKEDLAALGIS